MIPGFVLVWSATVLFVVLLAGLLLHVRRRRAVAEAVGDRDLLRLLVGTDLHELPWLRIGLVTLAGAALAAALIDSSRAGQPARRGPVVLVLDASASMLAEDADGRRLEAERAFARALVDALPDTPIGLVAFAGRAFSLTPPTRDRGAIEMYLATLDPTIVTQTGSALGAALRQGLGLLSASGDPAGATIILLGDGDETDDADAAIEASRLARRSGTRVYTVGIGGTDGAPVPALDPETGETRGFLTDEAGQPIVSRRSDDLLRSIARRGGGAFLTADGGTATATELATRVRGDETGRGGEDGVPPGAWLALAAFALLVAESALARREAGTGTAGFPWRRMGQHPADSRPSRASTPTAARIGGTR